MIDRVYLYGYKRASSSLKALEGSIRASGVKVVRHDHTTTRPARRGDLVVTWGSSTIPNWRPQAHINTPDKILVASDKLKTFQALKESNVPIPEFTTDIEKAKGWLPKSWVICRRLLRASAGKGIVLCKQATEIVQAPLYVKYQRKQKEFRVHVFKGTIIDVQEKRRRAGYVSSGNGDSYIRNHHNGWVFCRADIEEPPELRDVARSAIRAIGLDFGAVDIIYNQKSNKLFVLEVNTAPGLEGTTLQKYTKAILA